MRFVPDMTLLRQLSLSTKALFVEWQQSGATLLLFTVLEDTGNTGKGSEVWKKRFSEYNKAIREVGAEVGAIISDANDLDFFKDNRFLAFDRLHLNEEGHWRVAHGVLEVINYPFDSAWRSPIATREANTMDKAAYYRGFMVL